MNQSNFPSYKKNLPLSEIQQAAITLVNQQYEPGESAQLVKMLIEFYTGYASYQLIVMADCPISTGIYEQIKSGVYRLSASEPIQYIIGYTEFYGLDLKVSKAVLIPRPETEELVDWIVQDQVYFSGTSDSISNHFIEPVILDLGTGSGAIALGLKKVIKESVVYALDISADALEIARENAAHNNLDIHFIKQDILVGINCFKDTEFDIIVSNPPYILESELIHMRINVIGHEPHLALFVPDDDPMKFYLPIAQFAFNALKQGGSLYLEINEAYEDLTIITIQRAGFRGIVSRKDMHGKVRMIKASRLKSVAN